jgi:hypothetical protein
VSTGRQTVDVFRNCLVYQVVSGRFDWSIMKECLNCKKETKNPKFCSRSCSATYTNKTVTKKKLTRKCKKCDALALRKKRFCELHDQEEFKNKRIWIEKLSIKHYCYRFLESKLHPSSKFAHIRGLCRSWHKDKTKLPCHNCGYSKHVELCHIKPISSFHEDTLIGVVNAEENIVQLCPNCHWEFDNGRLEIKK